MKRVKVWKRLLALILTFSLIVPMIFQGERTAKAALHRQAITEVS